MHQCGHTASWVAPEGQGDPEVHAERTTKHVLTTPSHCMQATWGHQCAAPVSQGTPEVHAKRTTRHVLTASSHSMQASMGHVDRIYFGFIPAVTKQGIISFCIFMPATYRPQSTWAVQGDSGQNLVDRSV